MNPLPASTLKVHSTQPHTHSSFEIIYHALMKRLLATTNNFGTPLEVPTGHTGANNNPWLVYLTIATAMV